MSAHWRENGWEKSEIIIISYLFGTFCSTERTACSHHPLWRLQLSWPWTSWVTGFWKWLMIYSLSFIIKGRNENLNTQDIFGTTWQPRQKVRTGGRGGKCYKRSSDLELQVSERRTNTGSRNWGNLRSSNTHYPGFKFLSTVFWQVRYPRGSVCIQPFFLALKYSEHGHGHIYFTTKLPWTKQKMWVKLLYTPQCHARVAGVIWVARVRSPEE